MDIQVFIDNDLLPTFDAWLVSQGLYRYQMPIPIDDGSTPMYGIGVKLGDVYIHPNWKGDQ